MRYDKTRYCVLAFLDTGSAAIQSHTWREVCGFQVETKTQSWETRLGQEEQFMGQKAGKSHVYGQKGFFAFLNDFLHPQGCR